MTNRDSVRVSAPTPSDYRPYDTHEQFAVGYMAYHNNQCGNPNDPNSVAAQAWDRGLDYAARLMRWNTQR